MSPSKINKIDEVEVASTAGSLDAELEAEMKIFRKLQEEQKLKMALPKSVAGTSATVFKTPDEQKETDARSIFVNNVNFGAFESLLEQHFEKCGKVKRVTILRNKYTGMGKGSAYLEFEEKDSVAKALQLNNSVFLYRRITVSEKRTSLPRAAVHGGGKAVYHRAGQKVGNPYVYRLEGYVAKAQSRNRAKATFKPY